MRIPEDGVIPPGYTAVNFDFTPEENEAVAHALRRFASIANADAPPGMTVAVPHKVRDAIAARGLVDYAEELELLLAGKTDPVKVVQDRDMAAKAYMKAYAVHGLPIYLYEAGLALEAMGEAEDAGQFFRAFVLQTERFQPDEIDLMFLRQHRTSMQEALESAHARLQRKWG